mgnify:CR=1 FL=1
MLGLGKKKTRIRTAVVNIATSIWSMGESPCLDVVVIEDARIKPVFNVVQLPSSQKSLFYDKY